MSVSQGQPQQGGKAMRKTRQGLLNGAILLTSDQLQQKLNCGHQTAVKIGKEARARIYIGRRVWYDIKKIENYIDRLGI